MLRGAVHYDGVLVSSYDEADGYIRCDYALVDGNRLDPSVFPPLRLDPQGEGMQTRVFRTGESLVVNDVAGQIQRGGTYYTVDREGAIRKVPDTGPAPTRAALMVPVKHEGRTVGVVQVMSDHHQYTGDDLRLVEALVGVMGAAVRNARLYRIAAERAEAARVLEAVGDGILLVDGDGVVRFWNRAAATITGRRAEHAVGRPAADVLPGWEALVAQVPVAEGAETAVPRTVPLPVQGRERWLSFVAVRSGEGIVYAFRDLIDERLQEAKSEFVAIVSHELRTPLTAVLGAAQTLVRRGEALGEATRLRLVGMIASQAERLAQITDELLLASRLDHGTVRLETGRVDAAELARETIEAMRSRVTEAVRLELRCEAEPAPAAADPDRARQVLVNLIDNAVKYSPDGGAVTVSVAAGEVHVRLAVSDEGPGIPPFEQLRIFEKFYRVEPNLSREPGGTGLGLYISRELARRMGGALTVKSEPGAGSTFTFELPAAG